MICLFVRSNHGGQRQVTENVLKYSGGLKSAQLHMNPRFTRGNVAQNTRESRHYDNVSTIRLPCAHF